MLLCLFGNRNRPAQKCNYASLVTETYQHRWAEFPSSMWLWFGNRNRPAQKCNYASLVTTTNQHGWAKFPSSLWLWGVQSYNPICSSRTVPETLVGGSGFNSTAGNLISVPVLLTSTQKKKKKKKKKGQSQITARPKDNAKIINRTNYIVKSLSVLCKWQSMWNHRQYKRTPRSHL